MMEELGHILRSRDTAENDLKEAFYWNKKAARRKSLRGISGVGECLIRGIGVERNVPKGVRYLMDAGEAGHYWALERLARYYRRGTGVAVNKKKTLAVYHRTVGKYEWRNFDQGEMYKNGEGARANPLLCV